MIDAKKLTESIAARCRVAYIAYREQYEQDRSGRAATYRPGPQWDGGIGSNGREHKPIWPKIAQFMIKHKLDPEKAIWLRFAFSSKKNTKPPWPNQIAADKYLELYEGEVELESADDVAISFATEKQHCITRISVASAYHEGTTEQLWRSVLLDDTIPVSPLMRYCVAYSEGYRSICRVYEDKAIMQYLFASDAYDDTWGSWIPDNLRKKARKIFNSAIGEEEDDG